MPVLMYSYDSEYMDEAGADISFVTTDAVQKLIKHHLHPTQARTVIPEYETMPCILLWSKYDHEHKNKYLDGYNIYHLPIKEG